MSAPVPWKPLSRVVRGASAAGLVFAAMLSPGRGQAEQQPPAAAAPAAANAAATAADAVRRAAADYAACFNDRNFAALGGHWTDRAELVEGAGRLVGRERIVASIRAWLERHPQARLEIEVTDVAFPAASLARVSGRMTFTSRPGGKPVVSRFASLRVLEEGTWRIAESLVVPTQAAVLDELDWLVGTWKNEPGAAGDEIEVSFSRPAGGGCIVGRTTIKPATGKSREIVQIIHADRGTGSVRTWIFDSSGARAEGVVEADGASYHQSLVGTPAETADGSVARWVHVIAPTGEGRFTLHAIERSIDGVPLPDGSPQQFRKVR